MQFFVRTSDRLILSYGQSSPAATAPAGVVIVDSTPTTAAAVLAAYAGPNGGVTLAADGTVTALPVPTPDPVAAALRSAVFAIALSAVGVTLANLTPAQVKALAAVLLYKAGGVDPVTQQVLPLAGWA